jgi:hypothetical protein
MAASHGTDPDGAARLVLALTGGCEDRLSGCHLTATDDLSDLLGDIDRIQREDLLTCA